MKSPYKLASLAVLGSLAVVAACAEGTADPMVPPPAEPAQVAEPTEPTESAKVPPPSSGDAKDDKTQPADGGTDAAGPKAPTGTDAGTCKTVSPSNACGLTPQCGCAANETCDVTDKTTGAVSCASAGETALGSPCSAQTECAKGLTCTFGTCRPYCDTPKSDCSGTGLGKCAQVYDSSQSAIPNVAVCTIACDLRNPSAACGSNTCVWDKSLGAADCDAPGTKAAGATCNGLADCKPGLACVQSLFGNSCESWCRIGHDEECGLFKRCVDVYGNDAPVQDGEKLGHCQQ